MKNLLSQIKLLLKDLNKQDKILLFLGLIAFLCLISGCKVQAVNIVNSIPSSDVSKVISTNDFNNVIYELYGMNIDISSYSNLSSLYLDNTNYFKGLFQLKRRSDGKLFPAVGVFSGTNAKFYCDINGRYTTKYYFEMQYCFVINTENNSIDRTVAGFGDLVDTSTVYTYLDNDLNYLMYQLASDYGITDSQFLSEDYQSTLFFNFFDWFNGKFYKNNVTISNGGPSNSNTSIQINNQEHLKRDYFEYSDDNYISGDLILFDDYLEVKGLETSYSNLNLYLLRFPVVYNSYDNYQIGGPLEWKNISSINISTDSQTWEIVNPFPIDSGDNDYIYAFGIRNIEESSFGILSEYFSEKEELQADIINSIPFRNKYYVQIFDQFFIPKEVSGGYPSGDTGGVVTNPDGGDTDLTGGITGIWQAIINLPKKILDGIFGLFVPDADYFYNEDPENPGLWQRFSEFFQEKLGFLWDVLMFFPNLIRTIMDIVANATEYWGFTIPDIKVPSMTGVEETVVINSFFWSPYDWINQKEEFNDLYNLYLRIIDFFVYWGLVRYAIDTVMLVFGLGHNEVEIDLEQ